MLEMVAETAVVLVGVLTTATQEALGQAVILETVAMADQRPLRQMVIRRERNLLAGVEVEDQGAELLAEAAGRAAKAAALVFSAKAQTAVVPLRPFQLQLGPE